MKPVIIYSIDREQLQGDHYRTLHHQLIDEEQTLIKPWHQKRKDEFIAARGILRLLMGQITNRKPNEIRFRKNEQGKPYLDGAPYFNVSHSGSLIQIAISDVEVGIDIEFFGNQRDWKKIMDRFFHESEKETIQSEEDFLRLWTKKEALLKCVGIGITQELSSFDVLSESIQFNSRDYYFSTIPMQESYCGHLCTTQPRAFQVKSLSEIKFL